MNKKRPGIKTSWPVAGIVKEIDFKVISDIILIQGSSPKNVAHILSHKLSHII